MPVMFEEVSANIQRDSAEANRAAPASNAPRATPAASDSAQLAEALRLLAERQNRVSAD